MKREGYDAQASRWWCEGGTVRHTTTDLPFAEMQCPRHATTINVFVHHAGSAKSLLFCDECAAFEMWQDETRAWAYNGSRYDKILYPGEDSDVDICIERLMEVLCSYRVMR